VDGHIRRVKKPQDEWMFLLKDIHGGYISWEQYEDNQQQLASWAPTKDPEQGSQPREGCALLQGLVICGICGRRMV